MVCLLRLAAGLTAVTLLAACSTPKPDPSVALNAAETAAMAPLALSYPDVVMGLTINDKTLDVREFAEGVQWDQTSQNVVNAAGLKLWRAAWIAQHPSKHGTLTVHFVGHLGPLIATLRTKV